MAAVAAAPFGVKLSRWLAQAWVSPWLSVTEERAEMGTPVVELRRGAQEGTPRSAARSRLLALVGVHQGITKVRSVRILMVPQVSQSGT